MPAFGAHLPLIDLGHGQATGPDLRCYAATAARLGYATLTANDHLVWHRPWLDGPTALTSVLDQAGAMTLATSVALPTVRHPVVVAKWLTTLACLAEGPVIAGLGPGSSSADLEAVGLDFFDTRWGWFDEAFAIVRALVRGEPLPTGGHYDLAAVRLDPLPARPPQVWFGSWGSDRRLRALARVADGWLASAYNTSPRDFRVARDRLDAHLAQVGRDPARFPDAVATTWLYVSRDERDRRHVLEEVLAPLLGRDPEYLAARLPIGSPEQCVDLVGRYAEAGANQLLLWPLGDPIDQLERFAELVAPAVGAGTPPSPDQREA